MSTMKGAALALCLTGALVLAAGCETTEPEPSNFDAERAKASAAAKLTPHVDLPREDFLAALKKTQAAGYNFTVRGDYLDKQKMRATGAVSSTAHTYRASVRVTGGKTPIALEFKVVGSMVYCQDPSWSIWKGVKGKDAAKDLFNSVDVADPAGLAKFTSAIESVASTGPNSYQGTFDPMDAGNLPLGAPSIRTFGYFSGVRFRAKTDASGWVVSVTITLEQSKGPTLTLTTTMTGFGKPARVAAPPKSQIRKSSSCTL